MTFIRGFSGFQVHESNRGDWVETEVDVDPLVGTVEFRRPNHYPFYGRRFRDRLTHPRRSECPPTPTETGRDYKVSTCELGLERTGVSPQVIPVSRYGPVSKQDDYIGPVTGFVSHRYQYSFLVSLRTPPAPQPQSLAHRILSRFQNLTFWYTLCAEVDGPDTG